MSAQASPSLGQPRKSALKNDETEGSQLNGAVKAVQIAEPEQDMAQPQHAQSPHAPAGEEAACSKKQFPAGVAKRLSGRLPGSSSRSSLLSHGSVDGHNSTGSSTTSPFQMPDDLSSRNHQQQQQSPHHQQHPHHSPHHSHHSHRGERSAQRILANVAEWLQHEKAKKESRKKNRVSLRSRRKSKSPPEQLVPSRPRSGSIDSQSSEASLDRLQRIIDDSMASLGLDSLPSLMELGRTGRLRKSRSLLHLHRTASSDTEYSESGVMIPSCDVVLDNSKVMSYSGGKAKTPANTPGMEDSVTSLATLSRREEKESQAWTDFKNEIIRIAHTLKLKGWRLVPLNSGDNISVERLSGALTNAVYVVSPPEDSSLLASPALGPNGSAGDVIAAVEPHKGPSKRRPDKLLLRIYGPNADDLIDREKELSILKRLARKKIGPRLLGTFKNGRFEQYLKSTTLTPSNLREPETSKQIAKRMRELHDGVELLEQERNVGPKVLANWNKWVDKVEKRAAFLDQMVLASRGVPSGSVHGPSDKWKTQGFVCGVEWPVFKQLYEKYRQVVIEYYGGMGKIRDKLVFAHNDTQYGNILRVRPDDEKSPLLQPANEHKQLVVIDFEYAAQNLPGLEFANHFSEWAYNYHNPATPYDCDVKLYPVPDQQYRFVRSYVDHRPQISSSSSTGSQPHSHVNTPTTETAATATAAAATPPSLLPTSSASSIKEFMLDARVPAGGWNLEEKRREEMQDKRVRELLDETRLWRPANSALWISWGITQAKIPELLALKKTDAANGGENEDDGSGAGPPSPITAVGPPTPPEEEGEEAPADDEFDYLRYAQERALWFLGDCVLMGLIKSDELPEEVRERIKLVDY